VSGRLSDDRAIRNNPWPGQCRHFCGTCAGCLPYGLACPLAWYRRRLRVGVDLNKAIPYRMLAVRRSGNALSLAHQADEP
jgi:hypothetical protein